MSKPVERKVLKSIAITVSFCDTAWGQKIATISLPVGGESHDIIAALTALVAPLYGAAQKEWVDELRKNDIELAKQEVPF